MRDHKAYMFRTYLVSWKVFRDQTNLGNAGLQFYWSFNNARARVCVWVWLDRCGCAEWTGSDSN